MSDTALVTRSNGSATVEPLRTRAVWQGGMNGDVAGALAVIGEHYQLDPALGEVMILGSKVYVGIDGYLRLAEREPSYDGYTLEPCTDAERKALKVDAEDHAWKALVYRKDRAHPSVGYGHANVKNVGLAKQPNFDFLADMAQKRALHRALRGAFRVRLPSPDVALEELDGGRSVTVRVIDAQDVAPREPQPNWPWFWSEVRQLGVTDEQVHAILGVESVKDWGGTLEGAVALVRERLAPRPALDPETGEIVESPPARSRTGKAERWDGMSPEEQREWARAEWGKWFARARAKDLADIDAPDIDSGPIIKAVHKIRALKARVIEAETLDPVSAAS